MPCESYQDALTSAAAGAPPTPALRAHLIACADCRAALAEEEKLLASIDAGLRSVANAELPPSLIPGLRVRLGEPAPQRRWFASALIPAAAALVLAAFVAHGLWRSTRKPLDSTATASVASPPSPMQPLAPDRPASPLPSPATTPGVSAASRRAARSPLTRNAIAPQPPPEVIVPRDQELLLARYAELRRTHRYVPLTTRLIPTSPLEPLETAPIQIDVHDVKLLTDTDSR